MKKPNFFILGAPKCGTTSIAAWLEEHPQVFMSPVKEPDYFNFDIKQMHRDSLERYEALYSGVRDRHIAVGEASTGYLRSRVAVSEILKYSPEARFVVCLRNPNEMARSWHGQLCYMGWETERDFQSAWVLQRIRREGVQVPKLCPDVQHLLYGEVCRLGEQVDKLLNSVERDRVLFILVDDLKQSTRSVYLQLLSFLGISDDGRTDFPVFNEARFVPDWVSRVTWHITRLKRVLGINQGLGLLARLNAITGKKGKSEVTDRFQDELNEYFEAEVRLLERLLNRDLSHWISCRQRSDR